MENDTEGMELLQKQFDDHIVKLDAEKEKRVRDQIFNQASDSVNLLTKSCIIQKPGWIKVFKIYNFYLTFTLTAQTDSQHKEATQNF